MNEEELIQQYKAGERDFHGIDLPNTVLRGVNMSYADLRQANLLGSDLARANLQCADLLGASLYHAGPLGVDLSNAIIDRGTVFVRADLTGAILTGTHLQPGSLKNQ